jgi:50S ribosomal protein L16 3-hydroxylase
MTASVGFRTPRRRELARELLGRIADALEDEDGPDPIYTDRHQCATTTPGRVPESYAEFAQAALQRLLADPARRDRALGEALTEPKPQVWFEPGPEPTGQGALVLDRRSRMLYDGRHVFLNGESWRAGGRDAKLLRTLADRRRLEAADRARLGADAQDIVGEWLAAGWLHEENP